MKLDYDEIRRIHRLEKSTSNLVEVDNDFYNQLHEFILEEKQAYLDSLKDLSTHKAKDFNNLKKMTEDIVSMRAKKLLNKALIVSHTNETNFEHMSNEEKETYNKLLEILNNHNSVIDKLFSNSTDEKKTDSGKDLNLIKLKTTEEIPSFVGPDMKEYGPFQKEQVIELPYKVAKLLETRKLCTASME